MTWVSILLIGVGVGDLVRASDSTRSRWLAHAVTPVVVAVVAGVSGVFGWADVLALLVACGGASLWFELSSRTEQTGRHALPALAVIAATLAVLVAFSGAASMPQGGLSSWLSWADLPLSGPPDPTRVLLLLGLALFNIATANVIVRLVLLTIGAMRPDQMRQSPATPALPNRITAPPQPADRLKGGRLLGPMERLVILGLGLAGEFGAAGLVIAAKGLLRFPELQAAGRAGPTYGGGPAGIDDVTEYFLVGSFVSWLIALVSLAAT